MARTIDNLGVEVSTRFAEDQEILDKTLTREAALIPPQTELDISLPAYPSEYDLLFDTGKGKTLWADFTPPPGYAEQKKRLFLHAILPSLPSAEKIEAQEHRITAIVKETQEEEKGVSYDYSWERQREKAEEEKEQKILLEAMDWIKNLTKQHNDINGLRKQFQKG